MHAIRLFRLEPQRMRSPELIVTRVALRAGSSTEPARSSCHSDIKPIGSCDRAEPSHVTVQTSRNAGSAGERPTMTTAGRRVLIHSAVYPTSNDYTPAVSSCQASPATS